MFRKAAMVQVVALPPFLVCLQLRSPAARPAFEDMAMVQEAVQHGVQHGVRHGGDGRGVPEQAISMHAARASPLSKATRAWCHEMRRLRRPIPKYR